MAPFGPKARHWQLTAPQNVAFWVSCKFDAFKCSAQPEPIWQVKGQDTTKASTDVVNAAEISSRILMTLPTRPCFLHCAGAGCAALVAQSSLVLLCLICSPFMPMKADSTEVLPWSNPDRQGSSGGRATADPSSGLEGAQNGGTECARHRHVLHADFTRDRSQILQIVA